MPQETIDFFRKMGVFFRQFQFWFVGCRNQKIRRSLQTASERAQRPRLEGAAATFGRDDQHLPTAPRADHDRVFGAPRHDFEGFELKRNSCRRHVSRTVSKDSDWEISRNGRGRFSVARRCPPEKTPPWGPFVSGPPPPEKVVVSVDNRAPGYWHFPFAYRAAKLTRSIE